MSLPKPAAKIWIDCDKKKVMLSAPFNSYFNQLVRNLPRFFNKETKIWEFDLEYADQVADIAFKCWSNVIKPPFLLMEIFEYLTEDDLKDMYEHLSKRHRSDEDKTLLTLINKFFGDYIDLTEITRKKKRMIRLEVEESPHRGIDWNTVSVRTGADTPDVDSEIRSLFFGTGLEPIGHEGAEGEEGVIGSLVDVVLSGDEPEG